MAGKLKVIENIFDEDSIEPDKVYKKNEVNSPNVILLILLIAAFVGGAFYFYFSSITAGAKALENAYNSSFYDAKESAKQNVKGYFYDNAEAMYHTSNTVNISVGNLKEVLYLEILKVSDVEYIVQDASDNSEHISSWIEVPGESIFVLDLSAAEFVVDNFRHHILIRVPSPEISDVTLRYEEIKILLFKDDGFNESIELGENIAKKQCDEAKLLIKKEFLSNQSYYLSAENAARDILSDRIKEWNPDIDDLVVEVEFYNREE